MLIVKMSIKKYFINGKCKSCTISSCGKGNYHVQHMEEYQNEYNISKNKTTPVISLLTAIYCSVATGNPYRMVLVIGTFFEDEVKKYLPGNSTRDTRKKLRYGSPERLTEVRDKP